MRWFGDNFFPMAAADLWTLMGLGVIIAACFSQWASAESLFGVARVGWMMAGLMFVAPVMVLLMNLLPRK